MSTDTYTITGTITNTDPSSASASDIIVFYKEVSIIKGSIIDIQNYIIKYSEEYRNELANVNGIGNKNKSKEIDRLTDIIKDRSKIIFHRLDSINPTKNRIHNESSTDKRIRVTNHSILVNRFMEVMNAYRDAEQDYKKKLEDKYKKLAIIGNEIMGPSKLSIESSIESSISPMSNNKMVLLADTVMDTSGTKMKLDSISSLAYIEQRQIDILDIEKSIGELNQLFNDLAIMVEEQSSILDNIESNVAAANVNVIKGTNELREANRLQRSARKKMLLCSIC